MIVRLLVEHPLASAAAAMLGGFGVAAYILRWEARGRVREWRRPGYLIGGDTRC